MSDENNSAKRCSAPFSGLSCDEIFDLLLAYISLIRTGRKDPKLRVAFKIGINATALMKAYQVSTSDHAIFGGAYTNYFIPFNSLSKEQIFEILKECNKGKHGPMATEVKNNLFIFRTHQK